jgi:NADPH:quinone reductase-like Zn-dependent oxidoreductase
MRAAVNTRYGPPDVLEIRDVPRPEPAPGEVLVRIHATTVTRTDSGLLRASPPVARLFTGLVRPRITILGMDFAGVVEAVGEGVSTFARGERVFGLSPHRHGAHAEYICIPADETIAPMPADLSFREAVLCEGAWYADSTLRAFGLGPGHRILIYGASGAIGTAAVQLARARGARVTAVVATRHLELASSLGAHHVVDYTAEDFTRIGETFDFVFDAVGKSTYARCRGLLEPGGCFIATDLGPWCQNPLLAVWSTITRTHRVRFPIPTVPDGFADTLKAHIEANQLRAVIDRTYPFDDIAEAYRYVETGEKTGIVVIDVGGSGR